jgi:hypothetical protein
LSPITPQDGSTRHSGKAIRLRLHGSQTDQAMDFTIRQIDLAEPEESQPGTTPTTYKETVDAYFAGKNSASEPGTAEQGTETTHSRRRRWGRRISSSEDPKESTSPGSSFLGSLKATLFSGRTRTSRESQHPLVAEEAWRTRQRTPPAFTID